MTELALHDAIEELRKAKDGREEVDAGLHHLLAWLEELEDRRKLNLDCPFFVDGKFPCGKVTRPE